MPSLSTSDARLLGLGTAFLGGLGFGQLAVLAAEATSRDLQGVHSSPAMAAFGVLASLLMLGIILLVPTGIAIWWRARSVAYTLAALGLAVTGAIAGAVIGITV